MTIDSKKRICYDEFTSKIFHKLFLVYILITYLSIQKLSKREIDNDGGERLIDCSQAAM